MLHLLKISIVSVAALCFISIGLACAQPEAAIEYHFPMDGSRYVPAHSQIIVRPSGQVINISSQAIVVTGSISGRHDGRVVISDDHRTIIYTPSSPFELGENVSVQLLDGLKTTDGSPISPISFSFDVCSSEPTPETANSPFTEPPTTLQLDATSSLPSDLPSLQILTSNNPAPGDLFLTTFNFNGVDSGNYRIIMDSLGNPIYFSKPSHFLDWDFKLLPDGRYAFCEGGYIGHTSIIEPATKYFIMDSNFVIRDSFDVATAMTPYTTDFHDFELLPNGHALMLGLATLPGIDMSQYVSGGKKSATIIGAVIEEIDASKNPVWVWRSWDPGHYLDTDAINDPGSFKEDTIDAVHANAVQQDTDGNIILSARMQDEVSKINRSDMNGTFIWRFGGKHNQFQFINDSIRFSHQHAVRRIANGHITLFDNGNYHSVNVITIDSSQTPPVADTSLQTFARACEYDVNTTNMTATLVWHYDHDSTVQSNAMGYVQRLPNGNTLINWGLYAGGFGLLPYPAITEVDSTKKIRFEMDVEFPYLVYRASKEPIRLPASGVRSSAPAGPDFVLGEPFPNPCATSSKVILNAPASEPVALDLCDALGRNVREYFAGRLGCEPGALELETSGLPNGAYELVLRGTSGTASKQLEIVR